MTGLKTNRIEKGIKMVCWHKWSRWKQYEEEGVMASLETGKQAPYSEARQKRACFKCGKMQDEKIK